MSPTSPISLLDAYCEGWWLVWRHWKAVLVPYIVVALLSEGSMRVVDLFFPEHGTLARVLVVFYAFMVGLTVEYGFANMVLRAFDGKDVGFAGFAAGAYKLAPLTIAHLLFFGCLVAGGVLFVIPGLMLAVRLSLFHLYILDRDMGPFAALKSAWKVNKGHAWLLSGITLPMLAVTGLLIGMPLTSEAKLISTPFVGLFYMWIYFVQSYLYRRLNPIESEARLAA